MVTAVAAMLESPSRQCHRLAHGASTGHFELRLWRPLKRVSSGIRGQWAPPEIEIPNGGGQAGYTSLRDILSSPEYAAAKASSPAAAAAAAACGGGSCGDVHMIRHPLVRHAAHAYLQLTPSAREDPRWRHRRRRGPLCRLLNSCLSFIGALFFQCI